METTIERRKRQRVNSEDAIITELKNDNRKIYSAITDLRISVEVINEKVSQIREKQDQTESIIDNKMALCSAHSLFLTPEKKKNITMRCVFTVLLSVSSGVLLGCVVLLLLH